ncbi:MAG: hypothetical protein P8M25_18720, partial [Paracoccaceae bacterium]|nr:hypothetical protein [Paracoccaceae bacterium]
IPNLSQHSRRLVLLGCYLAAQAVTKTIGTLLAHQHLWLPVKTSFLLNLATNLSNHVPFILPVAKNIYTS